MGTVDGCGYNGQHKRTICDAFRPCHSIPSALKPVFQNSTDLLLLQLAQIPRSPDLAISVSTITTMTIQLTTLPLAHVHGINTYVDVALFSDPSLRGEKGPGWYILSVNMPICTQNLVHWKLSSKLLVNQLHVCPLFKLYTHLANKSMRQTLQVCSSGWQASSIK